MRFLSAVLLFVCIQVKLSKVVIISGDAVLAEQVCSLTRLWPPSLSTPDFIAVLVCSGAQPEHKFSEMSSLQNLALATCHSSLPLSGSRIRAERSATRATVNCSRKPSIG
jgi:hypothetical protein